MKDIHIRMQSSKEQQGEIRKPSSKRKKERKKAFLRDQGKEIEENNRMGKIRDLFKKIGDLFFRDIKGTFHAKMG